MQKIFSHNLALLFFLLTFSSFVNAQIDVNATSGCIPKEIKFSYKDAAITNIYWDFNDGGAFSINNSATHTYNTEGEYKVTITAKNGTTPISESVTIKIYKGYTNLGFKATPPLNGCIPLSINFTDTSEGSGGSAIKYRKWDFGDGILDSTGNKTPSHTFILSGKYNIKLTLVDNNGCVGEIERPDFIKTSTPPKTNYTTNPEIAKLCNIPAIITFDASTSLSTIPAPNNSLSYYWEFKNKDSSTLLNPTTTFFNNGVYPAKLTVTDAYNCSNTINIPITINSPTASFSVNDSVCKQVVFINNSDLTLTNTWFFGDNAFQFNNLKNVTHQYIDAGKTYDVKLSVTDSKGCSDDSIKTIFVDPIIPEFDIDPIYACSLPTVVNFTDKSTNAVKWLWKIDKQPGILQKDTNQNPSITLVNIDTSKYTIEDLRTYRVTLVVTNKTGCVDSLKKNYEIFLPTALFKIDSMQGCAPHTVNFTDTSKSVEPIVSCTWMFGDSSGVGDITTGNDSIPQHTYNSPGKYYAYLVITNKSGCTDTSYKVLIQVGKNFTPDMILSAQNVCPDSTVNFTNKTFSNNAIDGWNLQTNGELLPSCDNDSVKKNIFNYTTGPQDVTYTVRDNGCFSNKIFSSAVTVKGPIARFDHSFLCEKPYDYTFTCSIMESHKWYLNFGDSAIDTTINASAITDTIIIKHTYKKRGDFKVVLTSYNDASGCKPFKDSIIVKVREIKAAFEYDSLICISSPKTINADSSQDVYNTNHQGYEWYWGDNSHPLRTDKPIYTHAYDKLGNLTTTLIVSDINGCTDTIKHDLKVHHVKAGFIADNYYGCMPLTIAFADTSIADTTIVKWLWNLGDNKTSPDSAIKHTYTTPINLAGTYYPYQLKLTVTDILGCSSFKDTTIWPSIPNPAFSAITDTTICEGTAITFLPATTSDDSIKYIWNFGDNDSLFIKTNKNYSHIFKTNGIYDVAVTVNDSINCKRTYTRIKNAQIFKTPVAGFKTDVDDRPNLCHPQSVTFMDTSLIDSFDNRFWNLGDNSPKQPKDTIGTLYINRGTYTITLIEYSTYGCSDTIIKTLNVVGPDADFTIDKISICKDDSIKFTMKNPVDVVYYGWDFGDGTKQLNASPVTHTYNTIPTSGQTKAALIIWSADSACPYTVEKSFTINYVKADFYINDGIDTANCINEPITVTDTSTNANAWNWDFGNAVTSTLKNNSNTYPQKGDYIINLIATDTITTCKDTIEKMVVIYELPSVKAIGGDTCEGKAVQIVAIGGAIYSWQPAESLSDSSIANPFASPIINTKYTVTVSDSNNCVNTASTEVFIQNHPTINNGDETIIIGETIQLDASAGDGLTYLWIPDSALTCSNCPATMANPKNDIFYKVLVKDTMGCFTDTALFKIKVLPYSSIDIPDVFTPNADGINDIVYAKGWGIKRLVFFRIYNRWGEKVFETADINQGWDGYYQGKLQNSDTYVYSVDYESFIDTEIKSIKGYVSLLR